MYIPAPMRERSPCGRFRLRGCGGVFLRVVLGADAIRPVNNRLAGRGTLESAGPGEHLNSTHINLRSAVAG